MGREAEAAFRHRCLVEGVTCNESLQDDNGWDFLVEIPQEVAAGTPNDKRPAARSALVHVKWTGGSRRRLSRVRDPVSVPEAFGSIGSR